MGHGTKPVWVELALGVTLGAWRVWPPDHLTASASVGGGYYAPDFRAGFSCLQNFPLHENIQILFMAP